nr:hypothetical protein [uncultured Anaeromusa sp.]
MYRWFALLLCFLCLWINPPLVSAFPIERIALVPIFGDVPPQVAAALTQKMERAYRLPIYERVTTPLPASWDLAALEELRRNNQASLLLAIRLDTVQEFTYSHGIYDDDTLVSIRLQGTLFCLSDNPLFAKQTRKLNIGEVQHLSVNSGVEYRLFSEVDDWLLRIKEEQLRLRAAQPLAVPTESY